MKQCVEKIFGEGIGHVEVFANSEFVKSHGPRIIATTRPGKIWALSCDGFWADPRLVLHEYYHVLRQWAKGMTIPGHLLNHRDREDEAENFATEHKRELEECLQCSGS
jgi:hypothetical protein